MRVVVSKAAGRTLDALVAQALGMQHVQVREEDGLLYVGDLRFAWREFAPSSDWAVGGPMLDEFGISVSNRIDQHIAAWCAQIVDASGRKILRGYGADPLIAAMRALVLARLGDVVDLPKIIADNRDLASVAEMFKASDPTPAGDACFCVAPSMEQGLASQFTHGPYPTRDAAFAQADSDEFVFLVQEGQEPALLAR